MVMRRRKLYYLVGAAVIFAGLGVWALRGQGRVEYRTTPVQKGDVDSYVSASGTLNAVVTVQVGSQVSGNIMALYADFNSPVKKGQLVARIDPQVFQARVDQATATLLAAQSAVANAQATLQKTTAELSGANPIAVQLDFSGGRWQIDLDRVEAAITPKTRALFINTPSNPTGWTATREGLASLLAIARRHDLWIMADEIYALYHYAGGRAPSHRTKLWQT